jgi:hypothetical protein
VVAHHPELFNVQSLTKTSTLNGLVRFGPPNAKKQEMMAEAIWKNSYDPLITQWPKLK